MSQNSPTSTTPVIIFSLCSSYARSQHSVLQALTSDKEGGGREGGREGWMKALPTSAGLAIMPCGNGASITKLPLSVITGPAFILAIRRDRPGLPSASFAGEPNSSRLWRTLAYAKGTTSMGMPWVHWARRVRQHVSGSSGADYVRGTIPQRP